MLPDRASIGCFFTAQNEIIFTRVFRQQIEPKGDKVSHDKWVPVATAWRVLRLRMEERPSVWRVTANILN